MLTVKVVSPNDEQIFCGKIVGYCAHQKSIAISGVDQKVFLSEDQTAYVINANGKTISVYRGKP
ncbi:hypothetical protein Av05_006 [Escherichia phage Av-05]|uniref:Uncharacterized protein n=1 Tax=Escherichia phage Av-05 TaxID=1527519 RepID=A0A076GCD4_9CAUD|nr:hypothetical protein Av05_006 [Escherichia phage Av-05]AII27549.1 hypothetical protein Av05_006 [Escherichia phage Av-05]